MKQILFFVTISLFTLTSCHKGSGVNPGSEEFFSSSSNSSSSPSNSNSSSSNSSSTTTNNTLPQSAKNLIAAQYRGYTVKEIEQETEHGTIIYKVTIVSGNAKIRLLFDANWVFLGEKN
jgi:hypothetical protein